MTEGTPYSQEYLSLLARTGRLEALKRGRNWYTMPSAIGAIGTRSEATFVCIPPADYPRRLNCRSGAPIVSYNDDR